MKIRGSALCILREHFGIAKYGALNNTVHGLPDMEILITDVTEMGTDTYCVAGWDVAANRMVRPLPNASNWSSALVAQHGIVSGRLIRAVTKGLSNGIFPHRTEDTPIDPASIHAMKGVFSDWLGESAPHVALDLEAGFAKLLKWNKVWGGVRQGVHTLPRAQCSSLVSVQVPKANVTFSEVFGKLKATVNDGAASYQLTVSSKELKEAWRSGGLAAVNNAIPARDRLHIRVGLARPFDDPPKCYAMLNGAL
jgi:hypothetical protein